MNLNVRAIPASPPAHVLSSPIASVSDSIVLIVLFQSASLVTGPFPSESTSVFSISEIGEELVGAFHEKAPRALCTECPECFPANHSGH